MPLFQESIVKKYLSTIDESVIESAYLEYKRVYSPEKIKNIQVAKEEQYQEGFIKDVFGSVLGYSVYPEHPYNIETEKKNETNAKKADGAILKDEKVVGVIELKDNKTKNLEAVKDQAFGYKHNHKECSYVISSNFHKLRFYIDDATDYEEFDLYNLDKETFKRFYLYLRKEGLLDKNLPKLLREETKFHEEEISKKLYKDYSSFKRSFYENAVKNNPEHDKLILFKKSQKFLDRILFLLFAEDKGLVGTNSIVNIVEKWSGADDDYYQPLYEMVNKYFGHLYRGYTYQKTGEVIPQFGGELFAPDDVLEILKIDDEVLKNDLLILSKYDFNTDVDVNILGHIFEHSLNEVDDVEAELRGEQLDKTKSKRKKDGVFYTPKYITKYIVDNTLGKLCAEKKAELKLDQDIAIFEYQKADGKLNEKGKDLYERLNTYKAWLLTLKVCDPACGSGAFLNQALSFFIEEHKFVDDIIAELTNTPLRLFDTDLQILENNIFGVDINEESIEIAKLSLWLRTAQPGRKLSDLSNNIKCGNSLIDDPSVAGNKAFSWNKEFPQVFENGGFDAIIGNPPYFNVETLGVGCKDVEYLKRSYSVIWQDKSDILFYFMFKALELSKGEIGFIVSNAFLFSDKAKKLRNELLNSGRLTKIVNFEKYLVFKDASITSCISLFSKKHDSTYIPKALVYKENENSVQHVVNYINDLNNEFEIEFEDDKVFALVNNDQQFLNKKIDADHPTLSSICHIGSGMQTGANSIFLFEEFPIEFDEKFIKKRMIGENIGRYTYTPKDNYILYIEDIDDFESCPEPIKKHLLSNKTFLENRADKKRRSTSKWWNYTFAMHKEYYGLNKIWCSYRAKANAFYLDESSDYIGLTNTTVIFENNPDVSIKYILVLLNSKLLNYRYKSIGKQTGGGVFEYFANGVGKLPIPQIPISEQKPFIENGEKMISLNRDLLSTSEKFKRTIQRKFELNDLPKKLDSWYLLSFPDFIKELTKLKVKLSLIEETEWEEYFLLERQKSTKLKSLIEQTDKEIDRMVYQLYGLSEEEIQIVEQS